MSGCLRPTLTECLPVLAGILPAKLCRIQATLFLARRALEPRHLLQTTPKQDHGPEQRHTRLLKSRQPFVVAAKDLMSNLDQLDIKTTEWAEHFWNPEWGNRNTRIRDI